MTRTGFEGRVRVVSGSRATPPTTSYVVTVAAGALRLTPATTDGVVLDVALSRVRARPLGRGGSAVVDVDQSPLLLDFSDHEATSDARTETAASRARRVVDKGLGRHRRDRFLRAVAAGSP